MTFCRGAASCLRPADFVAKQFGASEGRHREQTCSVAFGSCVCVSLQWSAARADEAYAVAGGVAEFEGDRRSAHLSGREIYRVSSARNGLEGKCLRAADLADHTGWRRGVAVDAAGNGYRRISLVEGWEADCVYGAERGKQEREGAQGKVQRLRSV